METLLKEYTQILQGLNARSFNLKEDKSFYLSPLMNTGTLR